MKKVLSILLVSVLLIGCSEKRVLEDLLINKGNDTESLMYYKNELFNGISFTVYENGQLKSEYNYKDGLKDGFSTRWYENGVLEFRGK